MDETILARGASDRRGPRSAYMRLGLRHGPWASFFFHLATGRPCGEALKMTWRPRQPGRMLRVAAELPHEQLSAFDGALQMLSFGLIGDFFAGGSSANRAPSRSTRRSCPRARPGGGDSDAM